MNAPNPLFLAIRTLVEDHNIQYADEVTFTQVLDLVVPYTQTYQGESFFEDLLLEPNRENIMESLFSLAVTRPTGYSKYQMLESIIDTVQENIAHYIRSEIQEYLDTYGPGRSE